MGYGNVEHEPFTSLQALLEIIDAKEVESKFEETGKQVECELEVIWYEEQDDDDEAFVGHTFRDWFAFSRNKRTGQLGISKSPKSRLKNLIKNTLGQEVIDRGEFVPSSLKGQRFRAPVVRSGKNEDGDYSRVGGMIMPKPKRQRKDADLEGVDVENLDMGSKSRGRKPKADDPEPPDFSDLKETG